LSLRALNYCAVGGTMFTGCGFGFGEESSLPQLVKTIGKENKTPK